MCGNIACAVNTLDNEDDIPTVWRARELGRLEGPKAEHPGREEQEARREKPLQGGLGDDVGESCVVEFDDECDERDYCVREDETSVAQGDYVSLVDNPERFTGYSGPGPLQVWNAIYRENCFSKPAAPRMQSSSPFEASKEFRSVIQDHSRSAAIASQGFQNRMIVAEIEPLEVDDECVEKRMFYRIISGMHASISAHLCWDYLNQTSALSRS